MPKKRKFVFLKINNVKIKLQLDTGSDITIINEETWRKAGKPSLVTSKKIAYGVSGKKLNFLGEFTRNISFVGKTKKKKKTVVIVLKNTANLLGTNWIALFDLSDLPINPCNKINIVTFSVNMMTKKKSKNELKKSFFEVFSGLGRCTKTKAQFEVDDNVKLVFKPKRSIPFFFKN